MEHKIVTHHLFVDFKAAYDSVNRTELYKALEKLQVPTKIIRMVMTTMKGSKCLVRVGLDLPEEFEVNRGVRQGDSLACLLFNLLEEEAVRQSGIQIGASLFNRVVQILGYADDLDIAARSERALREAFLALEASARNMGLVVNEEKTKYMRVGGAGTQSPYFEVGHFKFEKVKSFTYLGSELNCHNDLSQEIGRRTTAASRCFYSLARQFRSKFLSKRTKLIIYKTIVRPVLTYAAETWATTLADENKLLVFERNILRRIFGPVQEGNAWRRRKNRELYQLYRDINVVRFIKLGRLRWAGHVARMGDREIPKRVITEELHGTRGVGRPRMRWLEGVAADARRILGVRNWITAAQDRENWRRLLEAALVTGCRAE